MSLTTKQIKQIKELETKFMVDIAKIKKKQAEIIKRYEAKKARFSEDKIRQKIKKL